MKEDNGARQEPAPEKSKSVPTEGQLVLVHSRDGWRGKHRLEQVDYSPRAGVIGNVHPVGAGDQIDVAVRLHYFLDNPRQLYLTADHRAESITLYEPMTPEQRSMIDDACWAEWPK